MRLFVTGASGFIGTHLVDVARARGHELVNVDIRAPKLDSQRPFWKQLDIMHEAKLAAAMNEFSPTAVVHLAARTDCVEDVTVEEGYSVNTQGTANVLEAVRRCPSVERVLITSTQFVFNKGSALPEHDEDYAPRTVYGQSKAISEQLTRRADLPCTWTITRPTNVWGPWHLRQRANFFYALEKGIYLHPGRDSVRRSYGYVGNVVFQMLALLDADRARVHKRVFYVGDQPIELIDWVNAFSRRLKGRDVRVVPSSVLRTLGRVGDAVSRLTGRPFLITSSRFHSMTEPYVTPMDPTFEVTGPSPFTLQDGVEATAAWLNSYRPAAT